MYKLERGKRELFWDEFLTDADNTTATLSVNRPHKCGVVMEFDEDWEGGSCDYFSVWQDDDIYRMYYNAAGFPTVVPEGYPTTLKICYAESKDGIHWYKPNLGIINFEGSKDNNIILWHETDFFDNFYAFKDGNPKCLPEEKYKAVAECGFQGNLWGYTSPDAIHWTRRQMITNKGKFDTLNIAFWDDKLQRYCCYIRDFHDNEEIDKYGIRDVRYISSEDFWNWTDPERIDFMGGDDIPLYTNNITPYYRNTDIRTGFPTRYLDHDLKLTKNYDRLTNRKTRMRWYQGEPRGGTTVTDCVFMSSRDGKNFRRFDEAWLTPGPEAGMNWVYGDCYPACGMVEIRDTDYPHADNLIAMFCTEGKGFAKSKPAKMYMYTTRLDGFASYKATYKPQKLTTKTFTFEGNQLRLNFRTSGIGYVHIRVLDENDNFIEGFETCDIFGDKVDRPVDFENGDISTLQGKPIKLEFNMSDAEIYSVIFTDDVI